MYSAVMKRMVGELRRSLELQGFRRQSKKFASHGVHQAASDAPLLLVACSGGRDSLALAYGASIVCPMLGLRCGAILIDHGLHPNSDAVARHAAHQCASMGLSPVTTKAVTVNHSKAGEESDARDARYAGIIAYARQVEASAVMLAHTLDDQAETVLIGLLRSAGTQALAGMPEMSIKGGVRFIRPMLNMRRADSTMICMDAGIDFWDDPTNGDDIASDHSLPVQYPLRSRIRHDLMPALDACSGSDAAALLAGNTVQAREDLEYMDAQARLLAHDTCIVEESERSVQTAKLQATQLSSQPVALRKRVIIMALNQCGIPFSTRQLDAIDALIAHWHGQGVVNLPIGFSANRQDNVIHLCKDGGHANR